MLTHRVSSAQAQPGCMKLPGRISIVQDFILGRKADRLIWFFLIAFSLRSVFGCLREAVHITALPDTHTGTDQTAEVTNQSKHAQYSQYFAP